MPDYSYLSTIGTPFHPTQSHSWMPLVSFKIFYNLAPSTFLGLSSALLNSPCALANLGYLLLPVWAWLYYVLNSLQCFFYVSTGVSLHFLQLYRSSPPVEECMAAVHGLCWLYRAPRVLLKGIEWWQTSRVSSSSCAPANCILIHTEALCEVACPERYLETCSLSSFPVRVFLPSCEIQ